MRNVTVVIIVIYVVYPVPSYNFFAMFFIVISPLKFIILIVRFCSYNYIIFHSFILSKVKWDFLCDISITLSRVGV